MEVRRLLSGGTDILRPRVKYCLRLTFTLLCEDLFECKLHDNDTGMNVICHTVQINACIIRIREDVVIFETTG